MAPHRFEDKCVYRASGAYSAIYTFWFLWLNFGGGWFIDLARMGLIVIPGLALLILVCVQLSGEMRFSAIANVVATSLICASFFVILQLIHAETASV